MTQNTVTKPLPPINRNQVEMLCYALRDIAAVVGLIEIAAADGDQQMASFTRGIQKTAEMAGQRLEEIAAALMEMATGEVQP
jgi:hypothetical protein